MITPRFVGGPYFLLAPRTRTFFSVTTPCAVFGAAGRTRTDLRALDTITPRSVGCRRCLLLAGAQNADLLQRPDAVRRLGRGRQDADGLEAVAHRGTYFLAAPRTRTFFSVRSPCAVFGAGGRTRTDLSALATITPSFLGRSSPAVTCERSA